VSVKSKEMGLNTSSLNFDFSTLNFSGLSNFTFPTIPTPTPPAPEPPLPPPEPATKPAGELTVDTKIEVRDNDNKIQCVIKQVWKDYYHITNTENTINRFFLKSNVQVETATNVFFVNNNEVSPPWIVAEVKSVGNQVQVRYNGTSQVENTRLIKVSPKWSAISYGGNDLWYRNTSYKVDTNGGKLWVQYEDERSFYVEPEAVVNPSTTANINLLVIGTPITFRRANPITLKINRRNADFICTDYGAGLWMKPEHVLQDQITKELYITAETKTRYGSEPVCMPPNCYVGQQVELKSTYSFGVEYRKATIINVSNESIDLEYNLAFETGAPVTYTKTITKDSLFYSEHSWTLMCNMDKVVLPTEKYISSETINDYKVGQQLFVWYGNNYTEMYPVKLISTSPDRWTISYGGNPLSFPKDALFSVIGFPYPLIDYNRRIN
jgi:hypothetical protein